MNIDDSASIARVAYQLGNALKTTRVPTSKLPGTWYRAIPPRFWSTALQTSHSMTIPSRFNFGQNASLAHSAGGSVAPFPLLYLAENPLLALFEVQALFGSLHQPIPNPAHPWTTLNVQVSLSNVLDLTDFQNQAAIEMNAQEITGDWRGYGLRSAASSVNSPTGIAPTQVLGLLIKNALTQAIPGKFSPPSARLGTPSPKFEGFLTISAKVPTMRNLIIFPDNLQGNSHVIFENEEGRTYRIDSTGENDRSSRYHRDEEPDWPHEEEEGVGGI